MALLCIPEPGSTERYLPAINEKQDLIHWDDEASQNQN